ncbi:MAG: 50S ribosomal protein L6 [Bdellovibrionaceae bacterium]|nr:50S ribosomal protein L6 [Pseudobdellovibrionaceae bacterium]|tara:strand:+ start:1914 stop:2456 length:543 start_codon:yes stop_codon:yes gene_type:complete
MSRIGRSPVILDKSVQVNVAADNTVTVKGSKYTLTVPVRPEIKVNVSPESITLEPSNTEPQTRAYHGLYRALIQNAVTGVSKGWSKSLELNGVGYRAAVSGKKLELTLGYSHPISFAIPDGIEISVEKQTSVTVKGADKGLVGEVSAKIRSFRPPEPYLGKGIRYSDEVIKKKAGKSASK